MYLEPFEIKIMISKPYVIKVAQIHLSDSIEIFLLTYGEREFKFQSDRPLIRKTGGRKKINWKALNGKVESEHVYEQIKQELESHIKQVKKPPFYWSTHPKNS